VPQGNDRFRRVFDQNFVPLSMDRRNAWQQWKRK
jgi:hypothetical protein